MIMGKDKKKKKGLKELFEELYKPDAPKIVDEIILVDPDKIIAQ